MKIFLFCSIEDFNKHRKTYNLIRRLILTNGHNLSYDWVSVLEKPSMSKDPQTKLGKYLEDVLNAVNDSDIVICENTVQSFENGYVINVALKKRKPVIVLTLENLDDMKETILDLPESEYLEEYYYSEKSIEDIITKFVQKYQGGVLSRFNIILERKQKNYLDWADRFYKQNKSEIIRGLIDKKAEEDSHYQRFMRNVT